MFKKHLCKRNSKRPYAKICHEALNSLIHGFEIRHVSALKETLYMLVDNDICDGYSRACSCSCDDRTNLSDLMMFVKADLCAFPVWCVVTDHGEDVTFGVYDIRKSAREISDSLIRSVIRDGRIDKTFSYNDVRAIAKEIIHDILDDEKSYENIPSETRLWMTMELPCTEAEIYMLLNRADHYFASVKKEMENALTDGICFTLGISPFEDEFGIAGYRRH